MTDRDYEDFVKSNLEYLTTKFYIGTHRPVNDEGQEKHIEMGDFASFTTQGSGYIEVKKQGGFLTADNNDMRKTYLESSGTIGFEIFQNWYEDRKKMYQGWLYAMYFAEAYTDIRREIREKQEAEGVTVAEVTAVIPGLIVFVLTDERKKPFACVAFEDIKALQNRLYTLCPDPEGWGLPDIDGLTPAADREYWDKYMKYYENGGYHNIKWDPDRGGIIKTSWYIPFRQLADIATVTMIGGDPDPAEEYKLAAEAAARKNQRYYGSAQLIQQRLNALRTAANGRRIDPEAIQQRKQQRREAIERLTGKPVHGNIIDVDINRLIEEINKNKLGNCE